MNKKYKLIKNIGFPILAGALIVYSFFEGREYENKKNKSLHKNDYISLTLDYAKEDIVLGAEIGGKTVQYKEDFSNIKDGGNSLFDLVWEEIKFDENGEFVFANNLEKRAKEIIGDASFDIKESSYDRVYGDIGCSGTSKENSLDKYQISFTPKK
jgi:hypothetical protein